MTQNIEHKATQNIVKTYQIVYKVFFVFGNITLATIIAIAIVSIISNRPSQNTKYKTQENEIKKVVLPQIADDITIYAHQNNKIQSTKKSLISTNNIIQHKGYTLPKYIRNKPENIHNIEHFNKNTYDISHLENAIKQILLQAKGEKVNTLEKLSPISTHKGNSREDELGIGIGLGVDSNQNNDYDTSTIRATYNIECMQKKWKITNAICDAHIHKIMKNITSYDLTNHHQELLQITSKAPSDIKQNLCKNISIYTRKTGDTSNTLDTVIKNVCDTKNQESYHTIKMLVETNKDLESEGKIRHIGNNQVVNEYIIHSLIQNTYNNTTRGIINTLEIEQYAEAWRKILNNNLPVSQFTLAASYYINQNLILKTLNNDEYIKKASVKKNDISKLIKTIKQITQGASGTTGISDKITNKNILNKQQKDVLSTEDNLKNNNPLANKKTYKEREQKQTGDNIVSIGEIAIPEKENIQISIEIENNTLQSIHMDQYAQWTTIINNLIAQKQITDIGQIEAFIKDKYDQITNNTQISTCDLLNQETRKDKITSCDTQTIVINVEKNNTDITYTITTNNTGKITKIVSNNAHMKKRIQEELTSSDIKSITETVRKIIATNREKESEKEDEGIMLARDKPLVIDHIRLYFGKEPENIGQRGANFVIGIILQGEKYFAEYHIKDHTIRNIILPNINIQGKRVSVPKFSLPLNQNNIENINAFKNDPLTYIKQQHPYIVDLYEKEEKEETK